MSPITTEALSELQLSLLDHHEFGNGYVHELEERMNVLKRQLSKNIDQSLLEAFTELKNHTPRHRKSINNEERKVSPGAKIFLFRQSMFTELFEIKHFRTLQNIFVAVIIWWAVNTAINDAVTAGDWRAAMPTLELIHWAFADFPVILHIWFTLMVFTLFVYPLVLLWKHLRNSFFEVQNLVDTIFLGAWASYEIGFLVIPCITYGYHRDLSVGCAFIFSCEQIRLLMKIHAFVRETVRQVMKTPITSLKKLDASSACLNENDKDYLQEIRNRKSIKGELENPKHIVKPVYRIINETHFSNYLYFLFAPTLVYRDQYPRTSTVNWWFVITNLAQVILCLAYSYYLTSRYLMPEVTVLASASEVTLSLFIVSWSRCATPGILLFIVGHYGLLHSWLNAFAEMLRFGDRLFYKDWWNAVSFSEYYRDWNRVVHDWLYNYVYLDIIYIFGPAKKTFAALSVFSLSCIFHQYAVAVPIKFYLPFFEFSMFITGILSIYVTPKASNRNRSLNVAMWVAMIVGNGLMICVYTLEWAARKRYQSAFPGDKIADFFVPRLFYSTGDVVTG